MFYGSRIKRRLKMAETTDPLVNNAKIMIEEVLGKFFSNDKFDVMPVSVRRGVS